MTAAHALSHGITRGKYAQVIPAGLSPKGTARFIMALPGVQARDTMPKAETETDVVILRVIAAEDNRSLCGDIAGRRVAKWDAASTNGPPTVVVMTEPGTHITVPAASVKLRPDWSDRKDDADNDADDDDWPVSVSYGGDAASRVPLHVAQAVVTLANEMGGEAHPAIVAQVAAGPHRVCTRCGHTGPTETDFGYRNMRRFRGPKGARVEIIEIRDQPQCRPCRSTASKVSFGKKLEAKALTEWAKLPIAHPMIFGKVWINDINGVKTFRCFVRGAADALGASPMTHDTAKDALAAAKALIKARGCSTTQSPEPI